MTKMLRLTSVNLAIAKSFSSMLSATADLPVSRNLSPKSSTMIYASKPIFAALDLLSLLFTSFLKRAIREASSSPPPSFFLIFLGLSKEVGLLPFGSIIQIDKC